MFLYRTDPWHRVLTLALAATFTATSCPIPSPVWASGASSQIPLSPPRTSLDLATLDLSAWAVPEAIGHIVDAWQPAGHPPRGLVIHLQDLHIHPEAQQHLSDLIAYLHQQAGVSLIMTEGTEGLCETGFYAELPDPTSTEQIARLFMREGLFSGAEYYTVTHPHQLSLWGAEDQGLYQEHLGAYEQGRRAVADAEPVLRELQQRLLALRAQLYPSALHHMLRLREADEPGDREGTFLPYVRALVQLARSARVSLESYPHVQALQSIERFSSTVNLQVVEREHQQLLKVLRQRLTSKEAHELADASRAMRARQIPERAYYQALLMAAERHGVALRTKPLETKPASAMAWLQRVARQPLPSDMSYSALRQYLAYLQVSRDIHANVLRTELNALEEAVQQARLTSDRQRDLARLLKQMTILEELLHAKLSPEHQADYQRHRGAYTADAWWNVLTRVDAGEPSISKDALERMLSSLPLHERFYEVAMKRDEALVDHTLQRLDRSGQATAILITGGFHTPGMMERLRAQEVAYVVVAPQISSELDEAVYHARLRNTFPSLSELIRKFEQQALAPASGFGQSGSMRVRVTIPPEIAPDHREHQVELTKRDATLLSFLALKVQARLRSRNTSIQPLIDWFRARPEAMGYGLRLTAAAGTVVLAMQGWQVTFSERGTLLAMEAGGVAPAPVLAESTESERGAVQETSPKPMEGGVGLTRRQALRTLGALLGGLALGLRPSGEPHAATSSPPGAMDSLEEATREIRQTAQQYDQMATRLQRASVSELVESLARGGLEETEALFQLAEFRTDAEHAEAIPLLVMRFRASQAGGDGGAQGQWVWRLAVLTFKLILEKASARNQQARQRDQEAIRAGLDALYDFARTDWDDGTWDAHLIAAVLEEWLANDGYIVPSHLEQFIDTYLPRSLLTPLLDAKRFSQEREGLHMQLEDLMAALKSIRVVSSAVTQRKQAKGATSPALGPSRPAPVPPSDATPPPPAPARGLIANPWSLLRRYEADILGKARQYGLTPERFKQIYTALIRAESAFRPNLTSPKGAKGLGQLMDWMFNRMCEMHRLPFRASRDIFDPQANAIVTAYALLNSFAETEEFVSRGIANHAIRGMMSDLARHQLSKWEVLALLNYNMGDPQLEASLKPFWNSLSEEAHNYPYSVAGLRRPRSGTVLASTEKTRRKPEPSRKERVRRSRPEAQERLKRLGRRRRGERGAVQTVADPFPRLLSGTTIDGHQLFTALKQKYPIRNLLRGGPIRQPPFFVVFEEDDVALQELQRRYGADHVIDHSAPSVWIHPDDLRRFQDVAQDIVSGRLPAPLVHKPNGQALGAGVFFLEKREDGHLVITMAAPAHPDWQDAQTRAIDRYLDSIGALELVRDPAQATVRVVLSGTRPDLPAALHVLWELVSTLEKTRAVQYDSGMMESMMPVLAYHGKAYDTRHAFEGNLASGQFELQTVRNTNSASFARIGSSAYFSNLTFRRGVTKFPSDRMFEPLYEMTSLPPERRVEFERFVKRRLRAEFAYLVKRLRAAGMRADVDVRGEFDLMWLPPDAASRGLPVPVLIEASVQPQRWQMAAAPITVRKGEQGMVTRKPRNLLRDGRGAEEQPFTDYLQRHGLIQYRHVRALFTPEIQKVLLDVPALRPVFLRVLPETMVGELWGVNPAALAAVGGQSVLDAHTAFSVGSAQVADRMAAEGAPILIGVTDEPSADPLNGVFTVANRRTAYFPLADGTWLGVKGAGQFGETLDPPHYWNVAKNRNEGLLAVQHADRASEGAQMLRADPSGWVQFLGYRNLLATPRLDGSFQVILASKAALVFTHVRSPHRLIKLPQLLRDDPRLERTRRRLSEVLIRAGELDSGHVLSPEEWLLYLATRLGRAEAEKQNVELFKLGIQAQDITLAGEEADLDELVPFDVFVWWRDAEHQPTQSSAALTQLRLNLFGLQAKLRILTSVLRHLNRVGVRLDFAPEPQHILEAFWRGYFNALNETYLTSWVPGRSAEVPAPVFATMQRVSPSVFQAADDNVSSNGRGAAQQALMLAVAGWAREAAQSRSGEPAVPAPGERGSVNAAETAVRNSRKIDHSY